MLYDNVKPNHQPYLVQLALIFIIPFRPMTLSHPATNGGLSVWSKAMLKAVWILRVKHPVFASSLLSVFVLAISPMRSRSPSWSSRRCAWAWSWCRSRGRWTARIWPSYLLLRLLALQQVFLRQPCALNAEHLAYGLGRRKGIPVRDRSIDAIKSRKGVQVMSVS